MNCIVCNNGEIEEEQFLTCCNCSIRMETSYSDFLKWFVRIGIVAGDQRQLEVYGALSAPMRAKITYSLVNEKYLLFEPLPFQRAFLFCQARVAAWFSGNQVGKTLCGSIRDLWDILCVYPDDFPQERRLKPPTVGRIWVPDFGHVDRVTLQKFLEWYPDWPRNHKSNDTWELRRNVQGVVHRVTHNPTGSSFDICSATQEPEVAEGWVGDWAHPDEDINRRAFTGTLRGLMARNGQMRITYTPLGEPWMHREILMKQEPGEIECFSAEIWENALSRGGYVADKAIQKMLDATPEHERAAREKGIFFHISRAAYPELHQHPNIFQKIDSIPQDWIVVSITDFHQATAVHTLWMAINQFNQKIFFDQLILKNVSIDLYVQEMLEVERRWHIVRIGARLVDRTMDTKYQVVIGKDFEVFNPYEAMCDALMAKQSPTLEKVTGSEGAIPLVRKLMKPVFEPRLNKEIQPFIIGHKCKELIETLPEYSFGEYTSGPMKGEAKEDINKAQARGAHQVDAMHYGIAFNFTWEELAERPPPPGTIGYDIQQAIAQSKMMRRSVVGASLVASRN